MAKPGSGKLKMKAVRDKQWRETVRSLKSTGRALRGGKRRRKKKGCYVATCVYGSYDCPEVWTLRRYRDQNLAETWYGRLFVSVYYQISPMVVRLFGQTVWFNRICLNILNRIVCDLQKRGYEATSYVDRDW